MGIQKATGRTVRSGGVACAMTLNTIYAIHDHMEDALRAFEKGDHKRAERSLWKAHDLVERVTIKEQARVGKV